MSKFVPLKIYCIFYTVMLLYSSNLFFADVAELADASHSKCDEVIRAGSSPAIGTFFNPLYNTIKFIKFQRIILNIYFI